MSLPVRCLISSLMLFGCALRTGAQVSVAAGIAPVHAGEKIQAVPRVQDLSTLLEGLDAGVSYSGVHSSSGGWYTLITPAVSYTFSRHFSADASTSIYFDRLVENRSASTAANRPLINGDLDPGDTLIGLHGFFEPGSLQDTITVSLTAPTGNRTEGFGTGQVTYDFSNHVERYHGKLGFMVDLGAGDSSGLFNNVVTKDYNSVGGLAHLETGMICWLPRSTYIEAMAYEQLPMGSQRVYRIVPEGENHSSHMTPADEGGSGQPAAPVSPSMVSEDNGFTSFVGLPLTDYISLSGYYNRSLRQHVDTVAFGITYVVRGTSRKRLSMIDRALREAEGTSR